MVEHKLLLYGDCIREMETLPDRCIDLILTDPPYGTTQNKWDSIVPLKPMWKQINRVIKINGAIVMTASQPFTTTLINSNMKMFKYCWVWEKNCVTGVLNAKRQPLKCVEDVVVFYGKQSTYNPQGVIACNKESCTGNTGYGNSDNYGEVSVGKYKQTKTGYPRQSIKFNSVLKTVHPTQKPLELMEYMIKTYTKEDDVVLDFTMGSGTTGVACVCLDRNFIGIDDDREYFTIAKQRIEDAEKAKAWMKGNNINYDISSFR